MSIRVKGIEQLQKKLAKIAGKDARRINRAANRSAAAAAAKEIRPNVPKDEGVTRRATTHKVFGRGLNVGGVAGADIDKMKDGDERPYNVDWLVDRGHVAPDGTFVAPTNYMERSAPAAIAAAERKYIERASALFDAL